MFKQLKTKTLNFPDNITFHDFCLFRDPVFDTLEFNEELFLNVLKFNNISIKIGFENEMLDVFSNLYTSHLANNGTPNRIFEKILLERKTCYPAFSGEKVLYADFGI